MRIRFQDSIIVDDALLSIFPKERITTCCGHRWRLIIIVFIITSK
jgi:hypothetical protein